MKTTIANVAVAAAVALGGIFALSAREIEIRHAAEVEFETERGHYYQLQRSTNLVDWQNVDDSIYGHGGRERRLRTAHPDDNASHEYFRVVVTQAPTNGFAPWSFAGLNISLDDRPGGNLIAFLTETNGYDLGVTSNAFVYTFTKTGTNEVRVETHPPTYYFDRRNVYLFTFNGPGRGTWVRDEFRKGQLKDRDTGVFRYDTGETNNPPTPPPVVPTEIPAALAGLAYTFQSGETPERLEFTSATAGTEFGDDAGDTEPNTFAYTYSLTSSNTASILVTFKPDKWDEYTLIYSGPAQGSFSRREFKDGALDDTDSGAFSIVGLPPGTNTNTPPGSTNPPPATPLGFTYTMLSGAIPERLAFQSASAGLQLDDSAPTDFTYTYASTGVNTFSLVVQFKADKWDEYVLTFTNGTAGNFTRRQFDRSVLKDEDAGPFTIEPTSQP